MTEARMRLKMDRQVTVKLLPLLQPVTVTNATHPSILFSFYWDFKVGLTQRVYTVLHKDHVAAWVTVENSFLIKPILCGVCVCNWIKCVNDRLISPI